MKKYTVYLSSKDGLSTGIISAENEKEAIFNARNEYKCTQFKVLSVSLRETAKTRTKENFEST